MKSLSPALQAHLDEGTTTLAWCWRLTRSGSDVAQFGFTDHDRPLTFDGTTFEPESGFMAAEVQSGTDLAVDAQAAEGALSSGVITERDILAGLWDNACVEVWRVNWQDPAQRVLMRRGALGEVRRGRVHFVAEVRSLSHLLNQAVGRVFQGTCDAALGDARCGVTLEAPAFRGEGTVAALEGERCFRASGLAAYDEDHFGLGHLLWSGGPNDGLRAEVMAHKLDGSVAVITLFDEPVDGISEGDGFAIYAGCDKTWATCRAKFSNGANFRGFPHIPGQDAVTRFAAQGDANTDEPL